MNEKQEKNSLLMREPPEGYHEEWTEILNQEKKEFHRDRYFSALIFRLENEWLAISTAVVQDIVVEKKIHTIPHRDNDLLKGTVNIGGQLKLVISLENLLEIKEKLTEEKECSEGYMCVIRLEEQDWVFKAEEILGIRKVPIDSLRNVPVTVSKSTANFLKGLFSWEEIDVGFLEEELLFLSIKRSIY